MRRRSKFAVSPLFTYGQVVVRRRRSAGGCAGCARCGLVQGPAWSRRSPASPPKSTGLPNTQRSRRPCVTSVTASQPCARVSFVFDKSLECNFLMHVLQCMCTVQRAETMSHTIPCLSLLQSRFSELEVAESVPVAEGDSASCEPLPLCCREYLTTTG